MLTVGKLLRVEVPFVIATCLLVYIELSGVRVDVSLVLCRGKGRLVSGFPQAVPEGRAGKTVIVTH